MNKKGVILFLLVIILILFPIYIYKDNIKEKLYVFLENIRGKNVEIVNEYSKKEDFLYVQQNDKLKIKNKQDLINLIYTILDRGYNSYEFNCPNDYVMCLNDVNQIIKNKDTINNLGNFVHPFNNFNNLNIRTNKYGKVKINVQKIYSTAMIDVINNKVDIILKNLITENMTAEEKILKIHDYIINNVKYDTYKYPNYNNAYGLLMNGSAQCQGYTDTMAIFLNRLNIKNYKVASSNHIWNALQINGKWYHLDLTWDDPVVENNVVVDEIAKHKFYLIDTKTLYSYDNFGHLFNGQVYGELSN